ncbi:unnamed protein product, partial [Medioppia subpectinata]
NTNAPRHKPHHNRHREGAVFGAHDGSHGSYGSHDALPPGDPLRPQHTYFRNEGKAPTVVVDPNWAKQLMYPYEQEDYLTSINSMKQMHDQPLPFRLPFSGFAFNYVWVHKDGYVTFNKGLKSYAFPLSFPMVPDDTNVEEDPSIIAAFFAHQDIPSDVEGSGVYFRLIEVDKEVNLTLKQRLLDDFSTAMAASIGWEPKFAFIVTWKNMTFANRRRERDLKTNTYQMILATDEMQTFVMFNYEQISWVTHLDNYAGLNGPQAFAYEYSPFSQNPRVILLPKMGWGNGIEGRFYFTIDEELEPGACVNKELDPNLPDRMPLHTSTDYIIMLGGQELNFTGPCLTEDSNIICRFDVLKVKGRMLTNNIGACITPAVMYEESPESRKEFDVWVKEQEVVENLPVERRPEDPHLLTIEWQSDDLTWDDSARVSISLWGYSEKTDVYPHLTFLI